MGKLVCPCSFELHTGSKLPVAPIVNLNPCATDKQPKAESRRVRASPHHGS